jgi:hypothetical protein
MSDAVTGNEGTMAETYRNVTKKTLKSNGHSENPEGEGRLTLN